MHKFTGIQYLKIAIANGYGLDKKPWEERIDWVDANRPNLLSMAQSGKADEPCLMIGAIKALEKAEKGLPIGYPISLDATSSGPQILSVLTCCEKTASLCNVINTGKREDLYTLVYKHMLKALGDSNEQIKREHVKKAIMTALYGSEATPKRVFGEGPYYEQFQKSMAELAPGAWELNKFFLDCWDESKDEYSWILPDNFHVHCKVEAKISETFNLSGGYYSATKTIQTPTKNGRFLGANTVHSIDAFILREIIRRSNYDVNHIEYISVMKPEKVIENQKTQMVRTLLSLYEQSGFLSARILEYIEPYNISLVPQKELRELLDSLSPVPFETITIHDCFRVHPNYGNQIRRLYILMLALIAKSKMLEFLLEQITGKHIPIKKLSPNMWMKVMDSEYALS